MNESPPAVRPAFAAVIAPTPRERAEAFARLWRGQANSYALTYGGPVYLVGSYLTVEEPADIDIRVLLAVEDLELWFGPVWQGIGPDWEPSAFARHREELKQSRRMTRRWRAHAKVGRRVDFQCQNALFNDAGEPILDERPRLRLDAVPNEMLRAGRGEP